MDNRENAQPSEYKFPFEISLEEGEGLIGPSHIPELSESGVSLEGAEIIKTGEEDNLLVTLETIEAATNEETLGVLLGVLSKELKHSYVRAALEIIAWYGLKKGIDGVRTAIIRAGDLDQKSKFDLSQLEFVKNYLGWLSDSELIEDQEQSAMIDRLKEECEEQESSLESDLKFAELLGDVDANQDQILEWISEQDRLQTEHDIQREQEKNRFKRD